MKIIFSVLFGLFILGCSNKKIYITSEYIINPNWDYQANAIEITKMKLKKDSEISDLNNLSQEEIIRKLEEDKSFVFVANVKTNGVKYSVRKVYFNKDNGFLWWTSDGSTKEKVIGNLQKDTWYKFSHLVTYPFYVFVYVDSGNNVHSFNVNLANY